jgi:uncharacterized protein involved in exopolysaccharide biosynthesis
MENSKGREPLYQDPCAEDEIDLYELLMVLKKMFRLIVVSTVIFLLRAIFYVVLTPPKYKSYGFLKVQDFSMLSTDNAVPNRVPITLTLISPLTVKELINYLNKLLNSPNKIKQK